MKDLRIAVLLAGTAVAAPSWDFFGGKGPAFQWPPLPGHGGSIDPGSNDFEALEHLGGNSPWFPAPNVFDIPVAAPDGCKVDQAVYISRHGSRYPDPSAYSGWLDLYNKIQGAKFTARGPLSFLLTWKPVLEDPAHELSQVSLGGYEELYDFGVELRTRYPGFYKYGNPFRVWTNDYPRTVDSARLFARGYIGPNSTTLGTVLAINSTAPSALADSLATSDSCPAFKDNSGATQTAIYDSISLPSIAKRLNQYLSGNLSFNTSDISNFPYLCGFESQITRKRSPWCDVFTKDETLQYEYHQDLRYWYGTGLGAANNASVMLPVLQGVVDILISGPNTTIKGSSNGNSVLGPLVVAFTHDNQINELASILGVFDNQKALDPTRLDPNRIYVSSRITPMRGTIAFERLNCDGQLNLRIMLNDAVYPVPSCKSGPGSSCPLKQYNDNVLATKWEKAGSFASFCNLTTSNPAGQGRTPVTFFTDLTLGAIRSVVP